eukprot:UN05272
MNVIKIIQLYTVRIQNLVIVPYPKSAELLLIDLLKLILKLIYSWVVRGRIWHEQPGWIQLSGIQ